MFHTGDDNIPVKCPFHVHEKPGIVYRFSTNLAAYALSSLFETAMGWCATFVRWLGTLTFAVYLCHYPLLIFFSAIRIGAPGTPQQHLWLFGGSFLVMALVTWFGDHARYALRRWLTALTRRLQRAYDAGVA